MKTIHWGMIGCGSVAEVKSGPGFYKAENSTLYAVTSTTPSRAHDYAKRHGVPVVYNTTEELLRDPKIDAVYIATPPAFHTEIALQCAAAGKPTYIEKPLANTYAGCKEIIDAFAAHGVKGYSAFYRRGMDKYWKMREILQSGEIGDLRMVNVCIVGDPQPEEFSPETMPWRVKLELTGGGKFLDASSHCIDILQFLLGDITDVQSIVDNQAGLYTADDIVTLNCRFASGVIGSGSWCFTTYAYSDCVEIWGSKGKISFAALDNSPFTVHTAQGERLVEVEPYDHVQQPLIQMIVDELNGQGSCPSTLESAAQAAKVLDAVMAEYRKAHGYQA